MLLSTKSKHLIQDKKLINQQVLIALMACLKWANAELGFIPNCVLVHPEIEQRSPKNEPQIKSAHSVGWCRILLFQVNSQSGTSIWTRNIIYAAAVQPALYCPPLLETWTSAAKTTAFHPGRAYCCCVVPPRLPLHGPLLCPP